MVFPDRRSQWDLGRAPCAVLESRHRTCLVIGTVADMRCCGPPATDESVPGAKPPNNEFHPRQNHILGTLSAAELGQIEPHLGVNRSRAVVQSAAHTFRLSSQWIKQEFNRNGKLRVLLLRYMQALFTQMSQTAVCNRHHSVDQQLCRWLLRGRSIGSLPINLP